MKYLLIAAFLSLALCGISTNGRAEFVFKKDGAIVKGKIVADEAASISFKNESGVIEQISRKDIIRVIYTDLYMGKVYARLTSGEIVEGYEVDEDRDNYFFRKDITKPEEFQLPRKKVMFISRTNPTDLKSIPSTEFITVTWSPPFKPAKSYRIYIRDVMNKEEKFKAAGDTNDLTYTLKNLKKSWSYEIYATAIADTGEESLPSEKIIANTLPDAPEKLALTENLSPDGKLVTLIFNWNDVKDPLSRVKSYNIYENKDIGKKKEGSSAGKEFVIKDFPAEGRHRFSVVAVNDLGTESDEAKAVYDAGYKIYARGFVSYLFPMGVMLQMATSGYSAMLDSGVSGKYLSFGLETGCMIYTCTTDIKSMIMLPVLLEADYRVSFLENFSCRPVLKAGASYDMIQYIVYDAANPLITHVTRKNSFDPMASAGAYLQYDLTERIDIFGGAEYATIFQKSGRMSFISGSLGAGIIF